MRWFQLQAAWSIIEPVEGTTWPATAEMPITRSGRGREGERAERLAIEMNSAGATGAERLLRGLAAGDESLLRSVLATSPGQPRSAQDPSMPALPPATSALVHLAALLRVDELVSAYEVIVIRRSCWRPDDGA